MVDSKRFDPDSLHEQAAKAIDAKGVLLFALALRRPLQSRSEGSFPSRREGVESLSGDDIIGQPKLAYSDYAGQINARYIVRNRQEIGLFDAGYDELRHLVRKVLKSNPFRFGFSEEFIEMATFDWWAENLELEKPGSLSSFLLSAAKEVAREHHLAVPISAIEIERPFKIGTALVAPMDKQMLSEMGKKAKSKSPEHAEVIEEHSQRIMRELGHLTVVHVEVYGEPRFAQEAAERTAFQIAEMFRFMSPAASSWKVHFPCFPHGCSTLRTTTILTIADQRITFLSQRMLDHGFLSWRMSCAEFERDMSDGFANFAVFFEDELPSSFAVRVGKAIGAFSEGVGTPNVNNRLIYAMSALEHLFLRNEQEPIQSGVGDRVAFLIAEEAGIRREIVANFKKAYGLRSKQVHHLASIDDEETLEAFFKNAWLALFSALRLLPKYEELSDFLDAIDGVKYGN